MSADATAPPRVAPRADIGLMAGYHSAQVDVDVRLNTNESPEPPPPAFLDAVAGAVASVDWHRYPDRGATALRTRIGALHGVGPEQVFVANGSNEVLQTLSLAYAGPGRSVAVFEPTYALHAHIARITGATVAEGERTDDFALDLDEVRRVLAEAAPALTYVCSPNNPTGMVETPETVAEVLALAPGLLVVDEAYGQFAPWSALALVDEDTPLVVTRTFSKTWSMAAARLGYLVGPSWVVERARQGRAAVPPRQPQAGRRAGRPRPRRGHGGAGQPAGRGAGPARGRPARPALRGLAVGRQLHLVPPHDRGRRRGLAAARRALRPRPRLLVVAPSRRLPPRHHRHP